MTDYTDALAKLEADFKAWSKALHYRDLCNIVQVVHEDGSMFVFHNAALWKSEPDELLLPPDERVGWIGVATEHHGDQMFSCGDLVTWSSRKVG